MLRLIPIVLALVMSLELSAGESYRQRADKLTQYIQKNFWDAGQKTYLDEFPRKTEGLPYCTMWGLGVQFTVLAGGTKQDAVTYRPWMDAQFNGLERYFNHNLKMYSAYLGGTQDIYYDDNHWMVLAYIEAYEITKSDRYLKKAYVILDACLGGVDDIRGGGSYWHIDTAKYPTKNTCSNAPLATALLRICSYTKDAKRRSTYLRRGREILGWTRKTLQDKDGIMWDNINVKTGEINKRWKFTYNTALMIQAHLELYRLARKKEDINEAIRLAHASKFWLRTKGNSRFYKDPPYFTVHLVEALLGVHAVKNDPALLANCRTTADHYWATWQEGRKANLKDLAAIARMQWLLANQSKVNQ